MKLSAPRMELVQRAKAAGLVLLAHKDELKLQSIVLFGSLARGKADYMSDIDILAVVEGGPRESSKAKDFILGNLYNEFEGSWPRIDAHTCSSDIYYGDMSKYEGTPFGDFLTCVKQDGVVIWTR